MALLRGSVVFAAALGAMPARPAIALTGVQLCRAPWWSKKPFYLRNPPYTILTPHKGQIETRVHFGEIAAAAKGSKGFGPEGIPIVASKVKAGMKGYTAPSRLAKEAYPSRARRTVHTLAELKAML